MNYKLSLVNKKHSKKSITCSIISLIAIVILLVSIIISMFLDFQIQKNIIFVGCLGYLSLILSFASIIIGIKELKEEESYKFYSIIGIVLSVVVSGVLMYCYVIGWYI